MSVVGGDGRRLLGMGVHLFLLRENFTSVLLRFLRSIRICKGAISPEIMGDEM